MSDIDKKKSKRFTDNVPPPATDPIETKKEELTDAAAQAQDTIYSGLSKEMSSITLENMKKLAPLDEFLIEVNDVDKTFKRKKLKPKMIRDLKEASRKFETDMKQITDPELRLDREHQLLAFKANLYLGMTTEEFENCDVEYLSQAIQATELRTQGFRKC